MKDITDAGLYWQGMAAGVKFFHNYYRCEIISQAFEPLNDVFAHFRAFFKVGTLCAR
jgi:hypothetical protein